MAFDRDDARLIGTALCSAFVAGTLAWIGTVLLFTGGDYMGPGPVIVVVPCVALTAAFVVPKFGGRFALWISLALVLPSLAFWIVVPDGWWAVPPPAADPAVTTGAPSSTVAPNAARVPSSPDAPEGLPLDVPTPAFAPGACLALKDWFDREIRTAEDDARAQLAVAQCLTSGELVGLTRAEVTRQLGSGKPATIFPPTFEFTARDLYYPVGKLPPSMVGGVPNLILRFSPNDRCTSATMVHTQ